MLSSVQPEIVVSGLACSDLARVTRGYSASKSINRELFICTVQYE